MYAADLIARCLEAENVAHLFGMVGTQNVTLFDAFRRSSIRVVTATSELSAGFMAVGAAKGSGQPAVLCTIPGPGFLYALPAIGEATLDSVPIVWITMQSLQPNGRAFAHQAIDQRQIASPLLRDFIVVDRFEQIPEAIKRAFAQATESEPGPVIVEIAPQLMSGDYPALEPDHSPVRQQRVDNESIDILAIRLQKARAPLFWLGGGSHEAGSIVARLAERCNALVLANASGRGSIPESHLQVIPADPGVVGADFLNGLTNKADLIVVWGAKLSHNGTCGFGLALHGEKLIQIDSCEEQIGLSYPCSLAIHGSCKQIAEQVEQRFTGEKAYTAGSWQYDTIKIEAAEAVRRNLKFQPEIADHPSLSIEQFFSQMRHQLPADTILTTDSGYHQLLTRAFWRAESARSFLIPTDLQSMGFGLPAALGAKAIWPNRPVIALIGDGGLAISGLELLTAMREKLPIALVVFNDGQLSLIRRQQIEATGSPFASQTENPEMEQFAASMGVVYRRYDEHAHATIWPDFLALQMPMLIEVVLSETGNFRLHQSKKRLVRAATAAAPRTMIKSLKRLFGR